MINLAGMYAEGTGVAEIDTEAVRWDYRALKAGAAPESVPKRKPNPMIWQHILEGAKIIIGKYNRDSDSFDVVLVEESGMGPLMVPLENVAKATGFTDEERLRKRPELIIGNQYETPDPLPVLSARGLDQRKKDEAWRADPLGAIAEGLKHLRTTPAR